MPDSEGYPTEAELQAIRTWAYHDLHGLMAYVHDLWQYADCGYWRQEGDTYLISTAGWSGNEDIIRAMQDNAAWWVVWWHSLERGGHYVFRVA